MIRIDKKIAIPTIKPSTGRPLIYPWLEMGVGDSFLVSGVKPQSIRIQASMAGMRYHRKFTCREMDKGIRVWRIK